MSYSHAFPPKDPGADLVYEFDWSAWLAAEETIEDYTLTASDTAITVHSDAATEDQKRVRFMVRGGVARTVYFVTCQIETSAGQVDERTVRIPVQEL